MVSESVPISVAHLIDAEDLEIGDGYRAKNVELSSRGIPFARVSNIQNGFDFRDADRFPEHDLGRVGSKISQPGDVVFTSKGSVGRFALVQDDTPRFVYSPQLCYWRSKRHDRIDPRWLYYWMQSREFFAQYQAVANQTDMAAYVSLRDQRQMKITLPDILVQRDIAHVLGALDDKIELNRRMSETLEAMARALFTSWFVDFDPVRAKIEGRWKPGQTLPGLPAHFYDCFPDLMVESKIGEVPRGWNVVALTDIIEVNPTRVLRKGEVAPYLDMANMPTRGHTPATVVQRPFGSGVRFMNGDTLMARITPSLENGKIAFVDFLDEGQVGWGSTEFIVLRPKPPFPEEYAYCLARSEGFRDFAIQSMTGSSGRQRVPPEVLAHFQLVAPPRPIVEVFGRTAKPIFARAKAASDASRTLAALRDALLPKLISGELQVKDAERLLEERAL